MTVLEKARKTKRVTAQPGPVARRRRSRGWCRSAPRSSALVGAAVLFVLVAVDLSVGDFPIPVRDVMRTLLGGGDTGQRFVVMELRLPQTVVAVAVGAALGLAGALTQTAGPQPAGQPRHPRRHRRRGVRRRSR